MKKTEPKERALSGADGPSFTNPGPPSEYPEPRFPREWDDAWLIYGHEDFPLSTALLKNALHGAQWKAAEDLLRKGLTLGMNAVAEDACAILAAIGGRLPLLASWHDEMLYIRMNKARAKNAKRQTNRAKPVARKKKAKAK